MHEQAIREAKKNIHDLMYERDDAVLRRARLVNRHKRLTDKIREAHLALVEVKIWLLEAVSDVEGLKQRNASIMQELEAERQRVQQASEEAERAKKIGQRLSEEVRELLSSNEDKIELLNQLAEGKSPDEVEMEISAEEAKLELIHAANPNVIREFERRAEEIVRLKRKMESVHEKLASLDTKLAEVMGKWEPKLEELVSKINDAFAYNFEQINCRGEVRVHKEEDFSQWALDVMVSFRYVFFLLKRATKTTPPFSAFANLTRCFIIYGFKSMLTSFTLCFGVQRRRTTPTTHRSSSIRRRKSRLNHLLPHGPAVHGPVALPRRRRNQPGHGSPQRAHGPRAHGGDCVPHTHEPVFPHHAQAAHRAAVRCQDAGFVHCQRGTHAYGGAEVGFLEMYCCAEEVDGIGVRGCFAEMMGMWRTKKTILAKKCNNGVLQSSFVRIFV